MGVRENPIPTDTEVVQERNDMIEGIDELSETAVKEVMVPASMSSLLKIQRHLRS